MNTNVLNSNSAPTYKDAIQLALILTVFLYFTVFLPLWGIESISTEPVKFCYETAVFVGSSITTQFVGLSGLNKYTQPKKETTPTDT